MSIQCSFRQEDVKIFTGNAGRPLAMEIAQLLGVKLADSEIIKFSDGEISVNIGETVRGCDVFIVQPTCYPANDNLMELLIMADAFKRASAGRINAVIPYYGYARQDRKVKSRDPITAKLMADLITTAGIGRVITMDLHAAQIQGYFNIPVDHLLGGPILADYFIGKGLDRDDEVVIVSPDLGSVNRTRKFAQRINVPIAIIDKRRPKPNVSEIMNIIGNVDGKKCIMVDDIIDTGGTISNAANALKKLGAKEVYAAATHAVLSGSAIERLSNSGIDEVVLLDTIKTPDRVLPEKFTVLSTAHTFANAISRIHDNQPLSSMFSSY
jgi:ribose-phosphate pyrophosphokinase